MRANGINSNVAARSVHTSTRRVIGVSPLGLGGGVLPEEFAGGASGDGVKDESDGATNMANRLVGPSGTVVMGRGGRWACKQMGKRNVRSPRYTLAFAIARIEICYCNRTHY